MDSGLLLVLCIGGVALIALVGMYRILTTYTLTVTAGG